VHFSQGGTIAVVYVLFAFALVCLAVSSFTFSFVNISVGFINQAVFGLIAAHLDSLSFLQ
jgi:hypothetical protein